MRGRRRYPVDNSKRTEALKNELQVLWFIKFINEAQAHTTQAHFTTRLNLVKHRGYVSVSVIIAKTVQQA